MIILTLCVINTLSAQYAPPAGQPGTTAIHADSNVFIGWASDCVIERGPVDISNPQLGDASYGSVENATGKADNGVISLGDGGIATLTFETPLANGDGWDFAVFENSFSDSFLELAFVEVSSNGTDFFRFESVSLTDETLQVGTFDTTDARNIYNLAGKYRAFYGTPFDLSQLEGSTGLDINNIVSIRIIDVVGSIDADFATYDSEGRIINDPWPTPFESSGFDLDAIGVIYNRDNTNITEIVKNQRGMIYPNPASGFFRLNANMDVEKVTLSTLNGTLVKEYNYSSTDVFDLNSIKKGFYIVMVQTKDKVITDILIVH